MSSGKRVERNVVKPLVVAVALALPGAAALAASIDDVVKTRADQNIDEQYGRDSVYAFSRDAKPLKPEQQASHDMGFVGDAYHKTTGFLAGAWHKTTAMFSGDGKSYAANQYQNEPQRYGRAGGYAGSDRVAVLAAKSDTMATANTDSVKTGEDLDNAAATSGAATPSQDQPSSAAVGTQDPGVNAEPSATVDYKPTGPSVDNPNSAITRDENPPTVIRDESQPAMTREEIIVIEPADTAATTDETPLQPLDQSPAANDDVVHTSPMPPSDNGRADSASSQDELNSQTR
jgi:hypothetical protein